MGDIGADRPIERGSSKDDRAYRIAITGDQAAPDGSTIFGDIGLNRLTDAGLDWAVIPVEGDLLAPDQLAGYDALLMMGGKRLEISSFDRSGRLRHVARFGAGYDAIDVEACTEANVILTNTPDAVMAPMAQSALSMVLALAHNLLPKDHLVRSGRWNERLRWQGQGIESRTVGIVGLGNIGAETARLFRALGVTVIAYNRSDKSQLAASLGVEMLPLEQVVATSDYLIVTVAGGSSTAGLISAPLIASMKPTASLVNVARGSVVDEEALIDALRLGRIAGAALDVFQQEPVDPKNPLVSMENTILTPHSLSWTDEFAAAVAESAISALLDVAQGRVPRHVVNPEVLA